MLIKCPECLKEISDKAAACPHCGAPAELWEEKQEDGIFPKDWDFGRGMPKCPVCGSYSVQKLGVLGGMLAGGISGGSKHHKCGACGHQF